MEKKRDRFIDLENALLDCIRDVMKKDTDPTLQEALNQELDTNESEDEEPGWV